MIILNQINDIKRDIQEDGCAPNKITMFNQVFKNKRDWYGPNQGGQICVYSLAAKKENK
jgi:hypothetical protein